MQITREWLLNCARDEAERHFDPATRQCLIPRETAWYAITLLESEVPADRMLANSILENLTVTDGTHSPCTLFVIYQRYFDCLTAAARANILKNLRKNLPISATVRYSDGNVNHPLAAYVHLICGGELLQAPAYVQLGRDLLQDFYRTISRRHKFHRQAEMAEYNSPTYTALTLWFLALAAEFAQDAEARNLALHLEERLWVNVAMHWHAPSQQFAGPFSRAYAEDSLGGFSALHCTFGFALQTDIFIDADLPRLYRHPSALIENAFVATLRFHVPAQARAIAFNKPWPYAFQMTTYCEQYHENARISENGATRSTFDDEIYPGGWGDLTTYQTLEYCLGTASRPYVNAAQTDSFSLRYRRTDKIQSRQDFRSAFTRMVFNDAVIGQDNFCHTTGFPVTRDYLYEEGRVFTYQHENQAILAYSPKRPGHRGVFSLRLDLIFSYDTRFDALLADGNLLTSPFEKSSVRQLVLVDANVFIAIWPLVGTTLANFPGSIRGWQSSRHFMFSFDRYRGPEQDFSRDELSQVHCGLVFLIEEREKYGSLKAFQNHIASAEIRENHPHDAQREVVVTLGGNKMKFCWNPISERIVERTWNGVPESVAYFQVTAGGQSGGGFCPEFVY